MTIDHKARAHALLSPSGANRWMACPPSVMLGKDVPETSSDAAEKGTLAHELAEARLQNYFYPDKFSKRKLTSTIKRLEKDPLWEKEMLVGTDTYLDYVKGAALLFKSHPYVIIEKRVDCRPGIPECYGTADCILISGDTIHVIDFKYGRNEVSAEHNPQLMLYALGAYNTYRMLYPIEHVILSIVQPNVYDGSNSWECTLDEVLDFATYAQEHAELALKGEGEFNPGESTCRYCPAGGSCRARSENNVKLAFALDKKPPLLSNEELGEYISQGEDVEKWLKSLKASALAECLAGRAVKGWKAVEGRNSREWLDMDDAFKAMMDNGIAEEILWKRVPLSVAQTEKELSKEQFAMITSMVTTKTGNPALVKETNKKPAITNIVSAKVAFEEEK